MVLLTNMEYVGECFMENNSVYEKIGVAISFAIMIAINILANVLPLNGVTTAGISDIYPSLITPAGYTFIIWILVYLLLFAFTIDQIGIFGEHKRKINPDLFNHIRVFYIITCLSNGAWLIAWHYKYIALSLMLIIIILICLAIINKTLYAEELTKQEKLLIRLPLSIYYGWITVATVTNAAVLLVSIRWMRYGISEIKWTIISAAIILIATSYNALRNKNIAYTITIIWAYAGILIRHISATGLNGKFPSIIISVIICIIVLLLEIGYIIFKKKRYGI